MNFRNANLFVKQSYLEELDPYTSVYLFLILYPLHMQTSASDTGLSPVSRHSQSAILGAFAGINSQVASCIVWVLLLDYRYKTKTPNQRLSPSLSSMITGPAQRIL